MVHGLVSMLDDDEKILLYCDSSDGKSNKYYGLLLIVFLVVFVF